MKPMKETITVAAGSISAALGAVGAAISGFGWCPCMLAPVFSFAGVLTLLTAFLSKNKMFFLLAGIILIAASLVLHKNRTCKIHKKA